MVFQLLKDMPWMFVIAAIIWIFVFILFVQNIYAKKQVPTTTKILFTLLLFVPVFGMLVYAILELRKAKYLFWATLLATLLTIADIWFFIQYVPTHFRRDITKEAAVTLSATELIKAFQSNETTAYATYNNKAVAVTGIVDKTETDNAGTTLILKTEIAGTSVSARLKNKQDALTGSTVTVKGIVTGFILDQVQLGEAVITAANASAPAAATPLTTDSTLPAAKPAKDTAKKVVAVVPEAKTYSTNKAKIRFFSSTPEEDIEATNSQVICKLNDKTGQLTFAALIKGFRFENELMQSHFNDKDYMNSDEFPKSEFKGSISNIAGVNFKKDGSYPVTATGNLTIHGYTKPTTATGTFTIEGGKLSFKSIFKIKRVDFGITTNEVADLLEITVSGTFE